MDAKSNAAISEKQRESLGARHVIIAALMTAFGLLTVFLTTSIILDLFDIRSREGNYVLFVVWANLISGVLFLVSAFAFLKRKRRAVTPLVVSVAVLVIAFAGLMIHINAGGAYETRTIGAMIFRITLNAIFAWLVYAAMNKPNASKAWRHAAVFISLIFFLVAGCQRRAEEHAHQHPEAEETQHAEEHAGEIRLNNGEKWHADEHTMRVVGQMEKAVSDFERRSSPDYRALGDTLTSQLNVLIAGCTMKGPAHDALHQWLGSFTPTVKQLSQAQAPDEGARLKRDIEVSLDTFHKTFQ